MKQIKESQTPEHHPQKQKKAVINSICNVNPVSTHA